MTYSDAAGEISQAILDPRDNVINGTAGDDVLTTQITDDPLRRFGNDSVFGQNGNDTIVGNTGNDTIFGGGGNDLIQWINGDGSDVVDGETGIDATAFDVDRRDRRYRPDHRGQQSGVRAPIRAVQHHDVQYRADRLPGVRRRRQPDLGIRRDQRHPRAVSGGTGNDILSAGATSTPISADGSDGTTPS